MKIRVFLSLLLIVLFCLMGGGSIEGDNAFGWIIAVSCIVLGIVAISVWFSNDDRALRRQKEQEEAKQRKEKWLQAKQEYNTWYMDYVAQNGEPDKKIVLDYDSYNKDKLIFVHEQSQKIYIQGTTYNFKDIISCSVSDNQTVIKGAITALTKTNTGSTVGRAIVGDVLAGPAGAIIGGVTAKKTTQYQQGNDTIEHDYTVLINVNSISAPILRIHTKKDSTLTSEIIGLMNVIITRR